VSSSDQEHLMEVTGRSAESLAILARALHVKDAELQPTLQAIAATAVSMLSPAQYAGVTTFAGGELIPRAFTGEPPLLLDRLQQQLGDGPCISAARHQSVFRIEDSRQDERWPEFAAEAAPLRVRSMLCVPLGVDERGLGALSLYAGQAEEVEGIVMERHGVTADAAFGVLSRIFQAGNIKLAEIARRLVETGELPGGADSES
jgi:putative methionine-R-sulfoxide reductase with GAF domain